MLLDSDIQKKFIQMNLHFQKEILIMYIIEKKNKNLIISFDQNLNKT